MTPDTVLKWIKKGRLRAVRTAGGHNRIDTRDLDPFIVSPINREAPLPATRSVAEPVETPPGPRCWEHLSSAGEIREDCRQCNVLFISSDEELQSRLACADDSRVAIEFAKNAYEASSVIQHFRPTFVIIDVSGVQAWDTDLLDSLAEDPRLPGLKIILIVTHGMSRWRRQQLEGGPVVSVLEKPLAYTEILGVINGSLEESRLSEESTS